MSFSKVSTLFTFAAFVSTSVYAGTLRAAARSTRIMQASGYCDESSGPAVCTLPDGTEQFFANECLALPFGFDLAHDCTCWEYEKVRSLFDAAVGGDNKVCKPGFSASSGMIWLACEVHRENVGGGLVDGVLQMQRDVDFLVTIFYDHKNPSLFHSMKVDNTGLGLMGLEGPIGGREVVFEHDCTDYAQAHELLVDTEVIDN